jgi:putative sterol carrier protein
VRGAALRSKTEAKAEQAFRAFIRRSDDRRLERTIGSGPALRTIFGLMAGRFVPERAAGFTGDIQYDLRTAGGDVRSWTVTVDGTAAGARPGAATDPRLTIRLTVADFARLAGGDLDPVKALLTGRLDLEGDFAVATRLGEMFGQAGAS